MSYAAPWMFFWILVLLGVLYWTYLNRLNKKPSFQFSYVKLFEKIPKSVKARFAVLPQVIKFLGVILVIVAIARPQKSTTKIKRNIEGIDIAIVLDVSDSMLIEDMKPENRLESSKATIKKLY